MPTIFELYGLEEEPIDPPKPAESGDFVRGAKVSLGQTVPILKGMAGLAGATAEQAFGEGGMSTALKDWGLKGYQEGMAKLAPLQKDTDELTTSWARAQEGDIGALADFAQYGLGYAIGQLGEAAAMAIIGGAVGTAASPVGGAAGALTGIVGKGAVKTMATSLIEKAVVKQAQTMMKAAPEMAMEEAVKQATKAVAKNIGATGALLGYGTVQELGGIYPEAERVAAERGEDLTGADIARVWGAGLAAGGVEGMADKLGLSALMGRVKIPGTGRAGSALTGAAGGMAIEGATEGVQTAIERYGAQQDLGSDEAIDSYINAAGLGAIGGGAIGGVGGLLHTQKLAQQEAGMRDLADAQTGSDAVDAFQKVADAQIDIQAEATSLMQRAAQMRAAKQQEPLALPAPDGEPTFVGDSQGTASSTWRQPAPMTPEEATANVARWGSEHAPMGIEDSIRILRTTQERGLDFKVIPHPAGSGFTAVPAAWLTPEMREQADDDLYDRQSRVEADITPRTARPVESVQAQPMTNDALVRQMVDQLRTDGTLQGRAFAKESDAGRITPADVLATMPSPEQRSPDARLAAAAAQAPQQTDPIADRLTQLVRGAMGRGETGGITVETSRARKQPDVASVAPLPAGSADGRSDPGLGGGVPVGSLADVARRRAGFGAGTEPAGVSPGALAAPEGLAPARSDAALTPAIGDKVQVVGGQYNGTIRTLVGKTKDGWALVSNTGTGPIEVKEVRPVGAPATTPVGEVATGERDAGQEVQGQGRQGQEGLLTARVDGAGSGLSTSTGPSTPPLNAQKENLTDVLPTANAGEEASQTGRAQVAPAQQDAAIAGASAAGEPAGAANLIEHTTTKGKELRGVVLPITKDQAREIDQFTFAKTTDAGPGFFIREKHMADPRVQALLPKAAPAPTSSTVEPGTKIDGEWSAFAAETGTKGVPRASMPQIRAEHRGAMTNFLNARGIDHEITEVPATSLKPTQAEFSPAKVQQARDFVGGDRSILVSSDGYVLDGHHQWLAKREDGEPVKVIRLNAPIDKLMTEVREFPSAEMADGATNPGQTLSQPRPIGEATPANPANAQADALLGGMASAKTQWTDANKDERRRMLTDIGRADIAESSSGADWNALSLNLRMRMMAKRGEQMPAPEKKPVTPQVPTGAPTAKYRDPATGQWWSGRGLRPKWLQDAMNSGKTLASFAVTGDAPAAAKVIGQNEQGQDITEDERGVRTVGGQTESVRTVPQRGGGYISVEHKGDWLTKEEAAARNPGQTPEQPRPDPGATPANAATNPGQSPSDRTDLDGQKITIDVEVGDTGKTAKMTMDAGEAVRDVRARLAAAQELVRCLS